MPRDIRNAVAMVDDRMVRAALAALKKDASRRRILRPAVSAALVPIKREARRLCPVRSGLLKRSIGSEVRKSRRGSGIVGRVYVRKTVEGIVDGKPHKPSKIAAFVEFGHGGPSPAPAHPFMRPAKENTRGEAMRRLTAKARERLKAEAKRAREKGKRL